MKHELIKTNLNKTIQEHIKLNIFLILIGYVFEMRFYYDLSVECIKYVIIVAVIDYNHKYHNK